MSVLNVCSSEIKLPLNLDAVKVNIHWYCLVNKHKCIGRNLELPWVLLSTCVSSHLEGEEGWSSHFLLSLATCCALWRLAGFFGAVGEVGQKAGAKGASAQTTFCKWEEPWQGTQWPLSIVFHFTNSSLSYKFMVTCNIKKNQIIHWSRSWVMATGHYCCCSVETVHY